DRHYELAWQFGTCTGHEQDKFAGRDWSRSARGHPLLSDAIAWLECEVESFVETGDRLFFLARVEDAAVLAADPPLGLHQLRSRLATEGKRDLDRQLRRDSWVDDDLVRQWRQAGYLPIALAQQHSAESS